jgi:hypothetical protein
MSEFRQAIYSILQRPAFAITALLTIALGIGANTAVYSVVYAVLLESLPFREPSDLVQVWQTHPELHNLPVSVPDYLDWRKSVKSVDLAAYTFQAMNKQTLLGQGTPLAYKPPTPRRNCSTRWESNPSWAASTVFPTRRRSNPSS